MASTRATFRLNAKGQITLPRTMRQRLIASGGAFVSCRAHQGEAAIEKLQGDALHDALLAPFLALLHADIAGQTESTLPDLPAVTAILVQAGTVPDARLDIDTLIIGKVAL